jgi:ATP-dependent Clp protease ATP-binding subunit ClpC
MFKNFTGILCKVLIRSGEESRFLGHPFADAGQLLIGLLHEETGVAAKILKSKGITLKDTKIEVQKLIGRGDGFVPDEVPFTPVAQKIIENSRSESLNIEHRQVSTGHLLLALIANDPNIATKVLVGFGIDLSGIRKDILDVLSDSEKMSPLDI